MQHAFGREIPQTLDDVCDPARLALIVYDMQVGIPNGRRVLPLEFATDELPAGISWRDRA